MRICMSAQMLVLSLVNNKGGVGKTTLAINLACAFACGGKVTGLIDIDPQCSATDWGDKREAAGSDNPSVVALPAPQLGKALRKAEGSGVDVVVVDTPAKIESNLVAAAELSSAVVVPVRPSLMDLQAMRQTTQCLARINRPALAVINSVTLMTMRDFATIAATLEEEWHLKVFPRPIWDRSVYRAGLFSGSGAVETSDQKARQEITSLADWIVRESSNSGEKENAGR